MNKIVLTLSVFFAFVFGILLVNPTHTFAAFPISKTTAEHLEKQDEKIKEKQQSTLVQNANVTKITQAEDTGIYGILSLSLGVAGWATAAFGFGFLLLLGALVTGIIGVNPKRKYKGLAIAGLILGAAAVLIFLLAVLILAAWVL